MGKKSFDELYKEAPQKTARRPQRSERSSSPVSTKSSNTNNPLASIRDAQNKLGVSSTRAMDVAPKPITLNSDVEAYRKQTFENYQVQQKEEAKKQEDIRSKYSTLDEKTMSDVSLVSQGKEADKMTSGLTGVLTGYASMSNKDKSFSDARMMVESGNRAYDRLLESGYSKAEIEKWVEMYSAKESEEFSKRIEEDSVELAENHPFLASAGSVVLNTATAPVAVASIVDDTVRGKIDTNNKMLMPVKASETIRSTVSDNIAEKSEVGAWLYNVGMSGADSLAASVVPGGAAILATNAAVNTTLDLTERGVDANTALVGGIAAGAFEAIFESVSIGRFKALREVSPKGVRDVVKNVVKSMGVNASEEMLTEAANVVYDTVAHGDLGNYNLMVEELKSQGMSETQAKEEAIKVLVRQVFEAGAAGGIMGVGFAGLGSTVGYARNNSMAKTIGSQVKNAGEADAIIAEGLAAPKGSAAYVAAQQAQKKAEKGKSVDRALGVTAMEIGNYISDNTFETKGRFANATTFDEIGEIYDSQKRMYEEALMTPAQRKKAVKQLEAEHREAVDNLYYSKTSGVAEMREASRAATTSPEVIVKTKMPAIGRDDEGNVVSVSEIVEISDGEITVKTSDGGSQVLDIKDVKGINAQELWTSAAEMFTDASSAQAFIDNYDGGSVHEYSKAFSDYYHLAATGMSLEKIQDTDFLRVGELSETAQIAAVEAGKKAMRFKMGVVDLTTRAKTNAESFQMNVLNNIGKHIGMNIVVVDTLEEYEGFQKVGSNQIVVALDSSRGAITRTASHETWHYAKQELGDGVEHISDFVIDTLRKNKGSKWVNRRLKEYEKQGYKTKEAQIDELVADSLFDAFTNERAVKEFASKNGSVLKKISDHIKQLVADIKNILNKLVATGSYSEIKAWQSDLDSLEKLNNMFLDVLDELAERKGDEASRSQEKKSTAEAVKSTKRNEFNITINDVRILQSIPRKSINEFTSEELNIVEKWARKFYKELGEKSPFFRAWFGDWRENDKTSIKIANIPEYIATNEARRKMRGKVVCFDTQVDNGDQDNKTSGWEINISREGETNTISHSGDAGLSEKALSGIRELIENAVLLDTEIHEHHSNNANDDNICFDHKLYALGVGLDGRIGLYKITVEEYFQSKTEPANKRFHNLRYIEKIADNIGGRTFGNDRSGGSTNDTSTIDYTVSDLFSFVKKYDSEFKPNPASKVVNPDGTPKVMYHGTTSSFTAFDKKKAKSSGFYGRGFYFTESKSHAGQYGNAMAVYLDIKNPLEPGKNKVSKEQLRKFLEAVAENEDYDIWNYGTEDISEIVESIYKNDAFAVIQVVNATAIGNFAEAIDLFNQVNGTSFDGVITPTETVVYEPTQIKSATDNIGTFDKSNPDIRYSTKRIGSFDIDDKATVDEDLLEELATYHPDAQVDRKGNITVYHRTSNNNAQIILQTGIMKAKEDALFFSSKENGYASDYGEAVIKLKIPSTMLRINDIFNGEVHFDLPLKYQNGEWRMNVRQYLADETNFSNRYSKKRYWKPDIPKADLRHIEGVALSELYKTENYLDNVTKWLYNVKNGKTYFALYSTEEYDAPTILYASIDDIAVTEHNFLIAYSEELGDKSHDGKSKTFNEILKMLGYPNDLWYVHSGKSSDRRNGDGDVSIHSRASRSGVSRALLNCLQDCFERRNTQRLNDDVDQKYSTKRDQLDVINETNPAPNTYSTWIRTVEDIKTLSETLDDPDWDYDEFNPDLTRADIQKAIRNGEITVYSSKPIENGVFVTPSRMEAESYSADGKVYEKVVSIDDVAWIDPTQGQYAKIYESQVGFRNSKKRDFAEKLDAWDGHTEGFSFVIGKVSKPLLDAGIPNKQIRIDASKIKKTIAKRAGMTMEQFKSIPELLEAPIFIIESKKDADSRVIMGDLYDNNGKVVTVVLKLSPSSRKGNMLDVLKVSSAEGRSHISSLFRYDDGMPVRILYEDTKRAQHWLNVNRLQLPLRSPNVNSNNIVANKTQNVNTKYSTKRESSIPEDASDYILDTKEYREILEIADERFELAGRKELSPKAIDRLAGNLLKKSKSNYSRELLAERLTALFDFIANSREVDWADVTSLAAEISKDILKQSQTLDRSMQTEFADVLKLMRETKVFISPELKAEIAYNFGSYEAFRRKLGNKLKVTVTDSSAVPLDVLWRELSEARPDMFDSTTNYLDMPQQLADFFEMTRPQYVNPYNVEMDMDEAAFDFALQIYEEYFSIPEIKTEARRYADKLVLLKAQYNAKIKEIHNAYRERISTIRRELKAENRKRIAVTKELYRKRNENYRIKRKETQDKQRLRAQIYRLAQGLTDKLIRPTDAKYVPQNLVAPIAEFAKIITEGGAFSDEKTDKVIKSLLEIESSKLGESLESVADETIINELWEIKELTRGKRLVNLTSAELKRVRDIARSLRHLVYTSNKMHAENIKETVSEIGESILEEMKDKKTDRKRFATEFRRGIIKPVAFFDMLESPAMQSVYQNLRNGEGEWFQTASAIKEKVTSLQKEYGYSKWKNKSVSIKLERSGETVAFTMEEALSVYATANRKQGLMHLLANGFVRQEAEYKKLFKVLKKEYKKDSSMETPKELIKRMKGTATTLTLNDIQAISKAIDDISKDARKYADAFVAYMSKDMADLGNKTALKLKGRKIFGEDYYFPIVSDPNHLRFAAAKGIDARLKNMSMTKSTVENAKNSIVIGGFTDTASKHCLDMAMYSAFTLPLEDFTRVFNYGRDAVVSEDGMVTDATSVRQELERVYGAGAVDYIKTLLTDINGGVVVKGAGFVNKLISMTKRDAVIGSLSVAIQQPSAIGRTFVYINPRFFFAKGTKNGWEELKRYAPVAGVKEMGYFDTNIGKTALEWVTDGSTIDSVTAIDKILKAREWTVDKLSVLPSKMDEITWTRIWAAVKAETHHKHPEMDVKSEKFLNLAGERFTYVIDRTQVYDSVFARSEWMRVKDSGFTQMMAFMNEPLVSLNMLYEALAIEQDSKGAKAKFVAKTMASLLFSSVLNSALKSIVQTMRDDDDDESASEEYLANFVENVLYEPLGWIPLIGDAIDAFRTGIDDQNMSTSALQNLIESIISIVDPDKSDYEKAKLICSAIGLVIGIPIKNVWREFEAVKKSIKNTILGIENKWGDESDIAETIAKQDWLFGDDGVRWTEGDRTLFGEGKGKTTKKGISHSIKEAVDWEAGFEFTKYKSTQADQALNAFFDNDNEHLDKSLGNLRRKYNGDMKDVNNAIRTAIKNKYIEGDMTRTDAENALSNLVGDSADDVYWKLKEWDTPQEEGERFSRYDSFKTAIDNGSGLQSAAKELLDNGVTKKDAAKWITDNYKDEYTELYKSNPTAAKELREDLLDAYEALGYNRYDKYDDIADWVK